MFGADYAKGRMVTGVSLSHSRGLGGYSGVDTGEMTSAVTGLYPWIGYKASERVTVWTVAGYGAGGLMLNPGAGAPIETGLSMAMAAGGGRGEIVGNGDGFALAVKADALWVGTRTQAASGASGKLKATRAAVNRVRTAIEGSQKMTLGGRMALSPGVEIGIRQDGGDAETGRGMDLGAGLVLADGVTGLAVDIRVRRLLVHATIRTTSPTRWARRTIASTIRTRADTRTRASSRRGVSRHKGERGRPVQRVCGTERGTGPVRDRQSPKNQHFTDPYVEAGIPRGRLPSIASPIRCAVEVVQSDW